uniref:Glycosyltransferase n=2 Tax=Thermorudis TaxID=1649508 RepID=A0A831X7I5_9BACT
MAGPVGQPAASVRYQAGARRVPRRLRARLLSFLAVAFVLPAAIQAPEQVGALAAWASDRYPYLLLYIPLGLFGALRWFTWLMRKIPAMLYRPAITPYRATTAIVTPVYREDPEIFRRAIESWIANRPNEIIAVIDVTDTTCLRIAQEYPEVRVIVTDVPGKRPALVEGILAARSEIVVLVDSDTIFASQVIDQVLRPFADPRVGGVGTRQKVYQPRTIWQRIADIYLDMRYADEAPALTQMGQAVSCLSGRTAAYRRAILLPLLDDFLHETFLGKACMSGEDKRLTTLVLRAGYRTYHQGSALVWSTFPPDFRTFVKQRIRWTRNSYRSDLRAMWEGWVWRHPYLAFVLLDKAISPYTLLVGLTAFLFALGRGHWAVALLIAIWWLLSRAIKIWPHLRRHPRDIAILPVFILVTFLMSFVKAYALATVHHHKWLTRPVEVVNDQVVRSDQAATVLPQRTPLLTRTLGSMLVATLVSLVQVLALVLGGGLR